MPSYQCKICRKRLKNPLSVKLGIGPVCRARENLQREFDFMHAQFELLDQEREYIFIRDVGHNSGRSVTNDAQYVVEQLYDYNIFDYTRIFYEDSEGRIDEILHSGKVFKGFKTGHDGVEFSPIGKKQACIGRFDC